MNLNYYDYDKISDDVFYIGVKTVLRFNVSLSRKNTETMVRYPFHKEYRYPSQYSKDPLVTIKRSFDYYLTLEKTDSSISIMIRPNDMILLQSILASVAQWFSDGTFGYSAKSKELKIIKKNKPLVISELALDKYIQFDPVVIVWEQTGQQNQGVRITLSDPNEYVDISIDRFYGLLYTINTFNMYQSAQNLLNYIQRPEYGYNLTEFDNNEFLTEPEDKLEGAKAKRTIGQKPKSFFDRYEEKT